MLRRDYIVRIIEEFGRALAQIRALRQGGRKDSARELVDAECEKLVAMGADGLVKLSETELLARVAEGQFAQTVHVRTLAVVTLLCEAAENYPENRNEAARTAYIKALNLLLEIMSLEDSAGFPDFVPKVETMVAALADKPMPVQTQVLLMRHYEATAQFGKAEDLLFSILDNTDAAPEIVNLGRAFYDRTLRRSDAALIEGNLPRSEAQEGLEELRRLAAAEDKG